MCKYYNAVLSENQEKHLSFGTTKEKRPMQREIPALGG